ncbi:hypothetical protein LshimejAT787_2100450 [Lyophyllum shimeji]|uniref:Uncharacterized protein n=1 Tax=Lyophyllum shimeji TaxID=47721 RepID=A0A9P3PY97_LYOSH|nr:hypothetical protein LshimejAT787_2100450 [Lyophyllum shimeji]
MTIRPSPASATLRVSRVEISTGTNLNIVCVQSSLCANIFERGFTAAFKKFSIPNGRTPTASHVPDTIALSFNRVIENLREEKLKRSSRSSSASSSHEGRTLREAWRRLHAAHGVCYAVQPAAQWVSIVLNNSVTTSGAE